jgi:hypothetical protein
MPTGVRLYVLAGRGVDVSDNLVRLVLVRRDFVPEPEAQQEARKLLASFVSLADEVDVETSEHVCFIDPGEHFEEVHCPFCGAMIDREWWNEAMAMAQQTNFTDLSVSMPCCAAGTSIDALIYYRPAGFAGFELTARNPDDDLNATQLERLPELLQCELRKIWALIRGAILKIARPIWKIGLP